MQYIKLKDLNFYKRTFRFLTWTALLLLIVLFILLFMTFSFQYHRVGVKYFATTSDGKLINIKSE